MPPGRRSANPTQQLILKTIMVGFVCLTIITLYKSCSTQQKEHQALLAQQNQARIDALAAEAEAQKHAADVEKLRIQRLREQDANQTSVTIAQLQAQTAASTERKDKESDALKELHRVIPENQPRLLSGNYSVDNQAGRIMHLKHDDRLLLTRKPADEDGKSEYDLKWSSGSTQLKEVVNAADNGLPQFSLVEKLENIKAHQIGWSDIKINYGTNGFSGRYRYEYGIDGLTFETSENSKYKIAIERAKEGYAGAKSGIDAGDNLVEIGGVSVGKDTVEQIESKLTRLPGSRLTMRVFRNQPDPIGITLLKAKSGNFGTPCIGATKNEMQSNEAVINFVQEDSDAAKSGIRIGDVITEIDKSSIQGLSNKEVSDRLLGKVGETKILHVSHFIDVELQYDQKDENTINVRMPFVQTDAPDGYSWSSTDSKLSRLRSLFKNKGRISTDTPTPDNPSIDFPNVTRHMAVVDDSKDASANLRDLPGTGNDSRILSQIPNAEVVQVLEERFDGWLSILRGSGQTGFVSGKNCKAQDDTAYPRILEFITNHFQKANFNRGEQRPKLTDIASDYADTIDYLDEGTINKQTLINTEKKYFDKTVALRESIDQKSYQASQVRYNLYTVALSLSVARSEMTGEDTSLNIRLVIDVHLAYDKANNAHLEIRRQKRTD